MSAGIKAERIHGNRSQAQRTQALAGFKDGRYPVLVATDIAARGIDVEELGHVVNFDVPQAPDDYIHRVGRTGRAEADGRRLHLRVAAGRRAICATSRRRSAGGCRASRCRTSTTPRSRKAQLEMPLAQRIAEIRARKRDERERAAANAARRAAAQRGRPAAPAQPQAEGGHRPPRPSHPRGPYRGQGGRGRGR